MTDSKDTTDKQERRLTAESILPGVQVGLLLLVVPIVGWISAMQLKPLQMGIDGVKEDVAELREEFQQVDRRIDELASRPPNETVMAHIEAILKRLDRLERP